MQLNLCLSIPAQALHRQLRPPGAPDPRNPAEYCSTVPPTQQASQTAVPDAAAAPPPSVMVPVNKSSLRRPTEGTMFVYLLVCQFDVRKAGKQV